MNNLRLITILFLTALVSVTTMAQDYVPGRLIVRIAENKIENKVQKFGELNTENGLLSKKRIGSRRSLERKEFTGTWVLYFSKDSDMKKIIADYEASGIFEYVMQDSYAKSDAIISKAVIPNDTELHWQWWHINDGNYTGGQTWGVMDSKEDADIDSELAWEIEQGSEDIVVAVLDAGMTLNHPDIDDRIWHNESDPVDGFDNDDNGFVDDIDGWDFIENDMDPTDEHGHGTNVATMIGAEANNELGHVGVDWNCRIMAVRVLDENGSGPWGDIAGGIYYAVDNGAHILNLSLGGSGDQPVVMEAVQHAVDNGVVLVAAMGNDNIMDPHFPASIEEVIAVGATNVYDNRAVPFTAGGAEGGSNYGDYIDVVAPGDIMFGHQYNDTSSYLWMQGGTSQATPVVSGICALLLAQDPSRTPEEIREIIRVSSEDQVGDPFEDTEGYDIYYGYGRVNAHQALLHGIPTSSNDVNELPSAYVYPNPASDVIYVHSPYQNTEVVLMNSLGVEVKRKVINDSSELQFKINDLTEGAYIVSMTDMSSNKKSFSKFMLR